LGYDPIAYWPLYETAGATAECLVNSAQSGAYTGVTLGQTVTDANGVSFVCPLFDGANDFANIYTATFRDAFDGSEGTAMIWCRVFNVGVWTDGSTRRSYNFRVDVNNRVIMGRDAANNRNQSNYIAGGANEQQNMDGLTSTDWMHVGVTWSISSGVNGEVKHYLDGSQNGVTDTALGVWAGNLDNTRTVIGASSTVPIFVWYGWLAHCAVWDTALSAATIADLATV
jgi:hypothetical protein